MNVIAIPVLILVLTRDWRLDEPPLGWAGVGIGLLLLAAGLTLAFCAIRLFVSLGCGTLAPWDPARELITSGAYRFSRNPLKMGLFLVLLAWCLLFGSPVLIAWAAIFIAANLYYIRRFEEPGLSRRFGMDYAAYCARVPRWFGMPPGQRSVLAPGRRA